jgi:Uma2 family endonuclease
MTRHAAARVPERMTIEEFLAWDGGGHVGKLELVDGAVRAMAPTSAVHSIIQSNIATDFNNHLRARTSGCRVGTEAPIVPPMGERINARAPDVSVTCQPLASNGTFADPVVIVEVLSPSSEPETWESIRALAGLASLQEIMVVQSTRVEVLVYRRDGKAAWPSEPESAGPNGIAWLASIGLDLPVAEIYRDTTLDA